MSDNTVYECFLNTEVYRDINNLDIHHALNFNKIGSLSKAMSKKSCECNVETRFLNLWRDITLILRYYFEAGLKFHST